MVELTPAMNPSANRIKVLMVPVLGVIMLYVLLAPADKGAAPPIAVRPAAGLNSMGQSLNVASEVVTSTPQTEPGSVAVKWPSIPLLEVQATNPFQRPESLKPFTIPDPAADSEPIAVVEPVEPPTPPVTPAEQVANEEKLQAELQTAAKAHRLSAIIHTSKGIGAMVGDHVVMVGDKLDDRFRVADIRPEGIVLELIERPAETIRTPKK